jgi:hypothetical protein
VELQIQCRILLADMKGRSFSFKKETPAGAWALELRLISTFYGRLVYLAGLLDPNTGQYEHYSSGSDVSASQVSREIRAAHEALFNEWVVCPLERKMSDVEAYINGLDQVDRVELVDAWLRLTPYKYLVPASIQGPERQKHVSDFEAILGLLKNVYGVAAPDRVS